jgi:endonuclease/exonuclease/phosphatase family metal-dependent hydrolase
MVLCCVLLCGCLTGPPALVRVAQPNSKDGAEPEFDAPTSLRVATFNVWGLPSWLNGASAERYPKIAKELDALASDVVLLQEVWTRSCFVRLSQSETASSRGWWSAAARRKGTFLGQNGLLTLSRFPIIGTEVKHFSKARLPDSLMCKGALKVTIAVRPGQLVNIWNVHLQDGTSASIRARQVAELIHWIQAANDGQVADIVGGDFNFIPLSNEFKQFEALVGPDIHQLAKDEAFPTWDGLRHDSQKGETLDHIFIKTRRAGEEVGARPRQIFNAARYQDRLSDHLGVEVLLTFRNSLEDRRRIVAGKALGVDGRMAVLSAP